MIKYRFWFIVMFFSGCLLGQQVISKDITRDTRWTGKVLLEGDIVVHKGATLFISPGTQILFGVHSDNNRSGKNEVSVELIVLGRVIAEGQPEPGKILFSSAAQSPEPGDWHGICVKNDQDTSIFRHCIVEYAYKGITCYNSSPKIEECEIRFNQYAGVSSEIRSSPRISKTVIVGNELAGVNCELISAPVIEKSIISQNNNGIIIFDKSKPDVGTRKARKGQSIGENLIFNNFNANIYNQSIQEINAQNNIWNIQNTREIEATLFDRTDNPTKGKIRFLPIFRKRRFSKSYLDSSNRYQ